MTACLSEKESTGEEIHALPSGESGAGLAAVELINCIYTGIAWRTAFGNEIDELKQLLLYCNILLVKHLLWNYIIKNTFY